MRKRKSQTNQQKAASPEESPLRVILLGWKGNYFTEQAEEALERSDAKWGFLEAGKNVMGLRQPTQNQYGIRIVPSLLLRKGKEILGTIEGLEKTMRWINQQKRTQ